LAARGGEHRGGTLRIRHVLARRIHLTAFRVAANQSKIIHGSNAIRKLKWHKKVLGATADFEIMTRESGRKGGWSPKVLELARVGSVAEKVRRELERYTSRVELEFVQDNTL
jgi:hypothetical protein